VFDAGKRTVLGEARCSAERSPCSLIEDDPVVTPEVIIFESLAKPALHPVR
jgi:hypothetical protein